MKTSEGWAIKYNSLSRPLGKTPSGKQIYERFLPNAFAESVDAINKGAYVVKLNVEHQQNNALTKLASTSYNLSFDHKPEGVYVRWAWLDDSVSSDLQKKIDAALVTGLSIEFTPAPGIAPEYSTDSNGNYIRTFSTAVLTGLAIVDEPAYNESRIVITTPEPVFSRSINTSEIEAIQKEIELFEQNKKAKKEKEIKCRSELYDHWMWLNSH